MSPFLSVLVLSAVASAAVDQAFVGQKLTDVALNNFPGVGQREAALMQRLNPKITESADLYAKFCELEGNEDVFAQWLNGLNFRNRKVFRASADINTAVENMQAWALARPNVCASESGAATEVEVEDPEVEEAVQSGLDSLEDVFRWRTDAKKCENNQVDLDDLVLTYIGCDYAEDCFVDAVTEGCRVSGGAAERAFDVIQKDCIQNQPDVCFQGFGEFQCDAYLSDYESKLSECSGQDRFFGAIVNAVQNFCRPDLTDFPSVCVADKSGYMDFNLCSVLIKVKQGSMMKDFALMGLYDEYAECSAEAGSANQQVGFLQDLFNGSGELDQIEQSLAQLHGCIAAKIQERCTPPPEPEPVNACLEAAAEVPEALAQHDKFLSFVNGGCLNGNVRQIYGIGSGNKKTLKEKLEIETDFEVVNLYEELGCERELFVEMLTDEGVTEESANDIFVTIDNWNKNENRPACDAPVLEGCAAPEAEPLKEKMSGSSKMANWLGGCPDGNIKNIYGIGNGNRDNFAAHGLNTDYGVVELYLALDCQREAVEEKLQGFGADQDSAEDIFIAVDNWYKNEEQRDYCHEAATAAAAAAAEAEAAAEAAAQAQDAEEEQDEPEVDPLYAEYAAPKESESPIWVEFVSGPAGDKSVDDIYGIGSTTAGRLAERGITKASQLIAQLVRCRAENDNKDDEQQCFHAFMDDNGAYSGRWTKHVYANLFDYCFKFPCEASEESDDAEDEPEERQCTGDWQRTLIQVYYYSQPNEDLCIKGSVAGNPELDIPVFLSEREQSLWPEYWNARLGADALTYSRPVTSETTPFKGVVPKGLCAAWTAHKDSGNARASSFNVVGDGVWEIDMQMDCSCAGKDGYFEFTAFIEDTRNSYRMVGEQGFVQETCDGGADLGCGQFKDNVHYGRCGFINSFKFNKGGECWIGEFPQ